MSDERETVTFRYRGKLLFPIIGLVTGLTAFVVMTALFPLGLESVRTARASGADSPESRSSGSPVTVQDLTVTEASGAVTVSWTAPPGAAGSSYLVHAVPEDPKLKSHKCTTRASSCVFRGMANGVAYALEARTANAEGALSAPRRKQAIPHPDILTSSSSAVWFDANDMTTVSAASASADSPVSQWKDKSGHKNVAVQTAANQRPSSAVFGKRRALQFSGSQNMIFEGGKLPSGSAQSDIFVAARLADPDAAESCFAHVLAWGSNRPGAARMIHKGCGTQLAFAETFGTHTAMKPALSWPAQRMTVLSARISRQRIEVRMNGKRSYVWKAPAKSQTLTAAEPTAMVGGAPWYGNSAGWKGLIGEVIVLSGKIKASDRNAVEQYLMRKWGDS